MFNENETFEIHPLDNGYFILDGFTTGMRVLVKDEEGNSGMVDVYEHLGCSLLAPKLEFLDVAKGNLNIVFYKENAFSQY